MSQADGQDTERGNAVDEHHQTSPVPVQPPQGETNFGDSSGPLFSMYSRIGEEEDNQMAERWQKDADGIVIFTGLFSAVVAAVVVVSVQDLRPNSQDISAFYLENIYELLADPNQRPSSVAKLPAFSPSASAVWVNVLWFLSLVISLTCAMLATSLQQWARRYVRITQPARCSPHKRARIRTFFANGVDKFHVPWAVEALPTLIHLSLFLFFAGLLVYLFNINHTVFSAVSCWVALLSAAYGCVTLMPIFRYDSPYYVPLSSTAWFLYTGIQYAVLGVRLRLFSREPFHRASELKRLGRKRMFGGAEGAAEKAASVLSPEIDIRVLEWTVDALGEDDALEKFYESIPGFYKSDVVKDVKQRLPRNVRAKILSTMVRFLHRTMTSNSISESVKSRRLAIYLNAASDINTSIYSLYTHIVNGTWHGAIQSAEVGHFLRSWDKGNSSGPFQLYIQGIISLIVATVRERNDRWVALTVDYLNVPERVVRSYLAHGDSVLLANYIHFTRQLFHSEWVPIVALKLVSEFDILNTLPELQHDFCTLWNETVREAQSSGPYCRQAQALLYIRPLYISLHRGTDAVLPAFFDPAANFDFILSQLSSDPFCNDPNHTHRSDQTHDVQEVAVGEVIAHAHAVTSITVPHRDSIRVPIVSSSTWAPSHLDDTTPCATSVRDLHGPTISESFHPAPELSPPSPAAAFHSPAAASTQTTTNHAITVSTTTSERYSTPAATTPIPQPTSSSSFSSTIAPRHSVSGISPFPPPALPNDMPSMDLRSFPTSSSQPNETLTSGEHPPLDSATMIALVHRQSSTVSGLIAAVNEAELGTSDDPQGLNGPTSTESSRCPPQSAQSAARVVTAHFPHPLGPVTPHDPAPIKVGNEDSLRSPTVVPDRSSRDGNCCP